MDKQTEEARCTRVALLFGRLTSLSSGEDKFWFKRDEIADVASGDSHAAVLTVSGQLFMLGSNEWGQLGVGHTRSVTKPVHVKALENEHVTSVSCGQTHTVAATDSGRVYSFGGGHYGQLGCGGAKSALQPIPVGGLPEEKCRMVACSAFSSATVTESGKLFMWGSNSEGQLGIEDTEADEPVEVVLHKSVHFVSCGNYHTVVISDAGEVIVFGESEGGKLGLGGEPLPLVTKPTVLRDLPPTYSAACGTSHTLFLTRDGRTLVCGSGEQGQLGLGPSHLGPCDTPTPIGDLQDVKVAAISSGATHGAVVSSSGFLLTFGDGHHGKLCHRQDQWYNVFQPQLVEIGGEVMKVACGGVHTLILLQPWSDGNAFVRPASTSPEQSLNDSSQSSSLASTLHRYQGFLSLRTSPSPPPQSLSSTHSPSHSLPPISTARERRRASKQRTNSSMVYRGHLGETGSVSTPGSGPRPGSDVTGDNDGDISDIEVTDTELSGEETFEAVDGGVTGGHLSAARHELVVSSGLSESEDEEDGEAKGGGLGGGGGGSGGGEGRGGGGGGEGGRGGEGVLSAVAQRVGGSGEGVQQRGGKGGGGSRGSEGGGGEGRGRGGLGGLQETNITPEAPLSGDTLSHQSEALDEERVTDDDDDLDSEEDGMSVDDTAGQLGENRQDAVNVNEEPAQRGRPQLRVFQEPPQAAQGTSQQGAALSKRLQFWKKAPQHHTTRTPQTGHTRSSLCVML